MPEENDRITNEDGMALTDSDEDADTGIGAHHDAPEDSSPTTADLLREESQLKRARNSVAARKSGQKKVERVEELQGEQTRVESIIATFRGYQKTDQDTDDSEDQEWEPALRPVPERPLSANGSLSTPDDTPSVQVAIPSIYL